MHVSPGQVSFSSDIPGYLEFGDGWRTQRAEQRSGWSIANLTECISRTEDKPAPANQTPSSRQDANHSLVVRHRPQGVHTLDKYATSCRASRPIQAATRSSCWVCYLAASWTPSADHDQNREPVLATPQGVPICLHERTSRGLRVPRLGPHDDYRGAGTGVALTSTHPTALPRRMWLACRGM